MVLGCTPAALPGSRPALDRFEASIRAFEQQDSLSPVPRGAALFAGSSSFALWDSMGFDLAPFAVVNRGFGGSTMAELVYYADRLILPCSPSSLWIYEGDNDLTLSGYTADSVLLQARRLSAWAAQKLPGVPLYFLAVKPSPARRSLIPEASRYHDSLRAWSAQDPQVHFVDIAAPMYDAEGRLQAFLFGADSLHMNRQGYALWKEVLIPELKSLYLNPDGSL
jgi:lysophospholipase L1-like esterase